MRKADVEEVAAVMRWLLRNPTEYETILTLVRLEEPEDETYTEWGAAQRDRVESFMDASKMAHCWECGAPTVLLADGRQRDWPSLDEHRHSPKKTGAVPEPTPSRITFTGEFEL